MKFLCPRHKICILFLSQFFFRWNYFLGTMSWFSRTFRRILCGMVFSFEHVWFLFFSLFSQIALEWLRNNHCTKFEHFLFSPIFKIFFLNETLFQCRYSMNMFRESETLIIVSPAKNRNFDGERENYNSDFKSTTIF